MIFTPHLTRKCTLRPPQPPKHKHQQNSKACCHQNHQTAQDPRTNPNSSLPKRCRLGVADSPRHSDKNEHPALYNETTETCNHILNCQHRGRFVVTKILQSQGGLLRHWPVVGKEISPERVDRQQDDAYVQNQALSSSIGALAEWKDRYRAQQREHADQAHDPGDLLVETAIARVIVLGSQGDGGGELYSNSEIGGAFEVSAEGGNQKRTGSGGK